MNLAIYARIEAIKAQIEGMKAMNAQHQEAQPYSDNDFFTAERELESLAMSLEQRRFAVAVMSAFDNELKIEIIEETDWQSAILKHSLVRDHKNNDTWLMETLEETKQFFFDMDMNLDVKEIV